MPIQLRDQLQQTLIKDDETPEQKRARLQREASADRVARLRSSAGIGIGGIAPARTDSTRTDPGLFSGSVPDDPTKALTPVTRAKPINPGIIDRARNQLAQAEKAGDTSSAQIQMQARLLLQNPVIQQAFDPTIRPILVPDTGLTQNDLDSAMNGPGRTAFIPNGNAPQVNPSALQGAIQRLADITKQNAASVQDLAQTRRTRAVYDIAGTLAPEIFKGLTGASIDTGFEKNLATAKESFAANEDLALKAEQEAAIAQGNADVKNEQLSFDATNTNDVNRYKAIIDQVTVANKAIDEQSRNINSLARQAISSSFSASGRSSSSTATAAGGLADKDVKALAAANAQLNARLQSVDSGLAQAAVLNNQILSTGFDRNLGLFQRLMFSVSGDTATRDEALDQATGVFSQIANTVPLFNTIYASASGVFGGAGLPVPEPYKRANDMASAARQIVTSDEDNIVKLERLVELRKEYGDLFGGTGSSTNALGDPSSIGPSSYNLQGIDGVGGSLISAIIPQESGGDPNAVNERTGAFGLTQINPQYADHWIAMSGMQDSVTPEMLKGDAQLQAQVSAKAMERVMYENLNSPRTGGDPVLAFRRMASTWYSGNPDLHMSTVAQGPNKNEPSVKDYVDNVMANWLTQNGHEDAIPDFLVPNESVNQLSTQNGYSYRDIADMYESTVQDIGGSGFTLEDFSISAATPTQSNPEDLSTIPLNVSAQERANMQVQVDDTISSLEQELQGGTTQTAPQTTQEKPSGTFGAGDPLPNPVNTESSPFTINIEQDESSGRRAIVRIDPDAFPDSNQLDRVVSIIEKELKSTYGEGNYILSVKDTDGMKTGEIPGLDVLLNAIRGK